MRIIQSILLLVALVSMDACAFRSHPLYQPLSESSNWDGYQQGYFDYQIDRQTYLIGYSNYITARVFLSVDWYVRSLKWLKGAQQYALYRAAEFAKSRGRQAFVVLHKDDWHYTGYIPASYRRRNQFRASPGAWVIIRMLDRDSVSLPENDDRVHLTDRLLQRLARENGGLPEYQDARMPAEIEAHSVPVGFYRWRSVTGAYDSLPFPGVLYEGWWKDSAFQAGSKDTQTETGRFTISVWDEEQISPVQILSRCIAVAKREGYRLFKIESWIMEEHIGGKIMNYEGKVWFKNTVEIVLQRERESNSIDSVFEVDEVLSHMDAKGAPLPR